MQLEPQLIPGLDLYKPLVLKRLPGPLDEEMHAVEEVDLAYTRIKVHEEHIQAMKLIRHSLSYTLGGHLVGNTSERL